MKAVVRVVAQALVIALLWGVATAGHAQPAASSKARARELYAQGQQLFRSGEFGAAQRAFEDAYRAVPNPVVLLSVSECQVRIEDYAGALASLKQYLAERANAPDRAQVEAQIATLQAKPGFVAVESVPTGAMIALDGGNTGQVTPSELSLRAGPHSIVLTAPGHQPMEQQVEVTIGTRQRMTLTLTPVPIAVVEPVVTPQPTEQPRRGRHAGAAVWTSLGIAGVAAITGTALGVTAMKKDKQYKDDSAAEHPNKAELADLKKRGERMALFADVNFGIAAVAGVTALVLYLTSAEPAEQSERAFLVTPELSPRELGVHGSLRF